MVHVMPIWVRERQRRSELKKDLVIQYWILVRYWMHVPIKCYQGTDHQLFKIANITLVLLLIDFAAMTRKFDWNYRTFERCL